MVLRSPRCDTQQKGTQRSSASRASGHARHGAKLRQRTRAVRWCQLPHHALHNHAVSKAAQSLHNPLQRAFGYLVRFPLCARWIPHCHLVCKLCRVSVELTTQRSERCRAGTLRSRGLIGKRAHTGASKPGCWSRMLCSSGGTVSHACFFSANNAAIMNTLIAEATGQGSVEFELLTTPTPTSSAHQLTFVPGGDKR